MGRPSSCSCDSCCRRSRAKAKAKEKNRFSLLPLFLAPLPPPRPSSRGLRDAPPRHLQDLPLPVCDITHSLPLCPPSLSPSGRSSTLDWFRFRCQSRAATILSEQRVCDFFRAFFLFSRPGPWRADMATNGGNSFFSFHADLNFPFSSECPLRPLLFF